MTLDVRLVLKTNDDALICMTYRGRRHGPPDVATRIERGVKLTPHAIISASILCIDRVLAIGIGHR